MNWFILGIIFLAIALGILVFMLVTVILGGIDVRPFRGNIEFSNTCPKCRERLTAHATQPGLYMCQSCKSWWQRYGTRPLIEVFGTPYYESGKCWEPKPKEGGNNGNSI